MQCYPSKCKEIVFSPIPIPLTHLVPNSGMKTSVSIACLSLRVAALMSVRPSLSSEERVG